MSIEHKSYRDVDVTIKRIDSEILNQKTEENSNAGLTSIAYAKKADNQKGASYSAKFVEENDLKFGIAITRSL